MQFRFLLNHYAQKKKDCLTTIYTNKRLSKPTLYLPYLIKCDTLISVNKKQVILGTLSVSMTNTVKLKKKN